LLRERGEGSALERRAAERKLGALQRHDARPRLGEAWFPVTLDDVPAVPGLLLQVAARPRVAGTACLPLERDEALTLAVHRWVAGLLEVEDPRVLTLPDLYVTSLPHGVSARGSSGQLSAAVALLSHLLGVPPLRPAVCSGALGPPGRLAPVERLARKRTILALEAPGVDAVLVGEPREAGPALALWLGEGWSAELEELLRLSPQALAREALLGHRGDRSLAEAKAREAIRLGKGHTRALAEWVVGVCLVHKGQAGEGLERMERALAALRQPAAPDDAPLDAFVLEELCAFQGIALLDRLELRRAREVLERGLDSMAALPEPLDQRAASVTLQLAGSLHRVLLLDGELEAAERVLLEWSLGKVTLPHEESRSRADLAELYRRAGRIDEAREQLELARARLRNTPSDQRAFTGRFQRLFRVRAGLAPPCWRVEPPQWLAWPQPGEVLETLLAVASGDALDAWLAEHAVGMELEPASSIVYLQLALGAVARHAARTGELVGSAAPLIAALRRLLPELDPGVDAALEALLAGEPLGWVRRCPY